MSGISRIQNPIFKSLNLNEWGQRDIIPNDFNTEIIETDQEFQGNSIPGGKIESLNISKLRAGSLNVDDYIQSTGFETGVSGWRIKGNGEAEFASGYFRSDVPDAITIAGGSNILLKDGGSINFTSLTAPSACTATLVSTATGNVNNGTHSYKITFVNDIPYPAIYGETGLGSVSNTVTVDANNKQVNLTNIPISASSVVTDRKIYRTKAGGSLYYLLTILTDNTTTTYTDNISDASLTGGVANNKENDSFGKILIDGQESCSIGPSNTFIGQYSGRENLTGTENTSIGYATLTYNDSGQANEAVGGFSLYKNTTGSDNIGVGYSSLFDNISGSNNIAIGTEALSNNSSASENVAIGRNAMFNTDSSFNTSVGSNSMYGNVAGNNNTCFGAYALHENQNGINNVAIGYGAGYYETGSNKLFIDNSTRGGESDARIKSLVYGTFNATALSQQITFNVGTLNILDGGNIATGTGTGLKIGTSTSQKLGFYNATPVDQPATVANATDAASVILRCNDIIARLKELGLIA